MTRFISIFKLDTDILSKERNMKTLLIVIFFITYNTFAQQQDTFIQLDSVGHYIIDDALNKQFKIFPQINNVYKGFVLKPFDRDGYYSWIVLKKDGYLKDTIVWMDNDFLLNLKQKKCNTYQTELPETELAHLFLNRSMILSLAHGRQNKKIELGKVNNSGEEISVEIEKSYIKKYKLFKKLFKKEIWNIKYDSVTYEDMKILRKHNNFLVVQKSDYEYDLDISKIESLNSTSSKQIGFIAVPISTGVGVALPLLYELVSVFFRAITLNRDTKLHTESIWIGGTIGLSLGMIVGISVSAGTTKTIDIQLQNKNVYDKYWELDRQTYFAIPNSENDKTIEVMDNQ